MTQATFVAFVLYSVIGCVLARSAYKAVDEDIVASRARGEDSDSWVDAAHILFALVVALLWWVFAFIFVWIWWRGRRSNA